MNKRQATKRAKLRSKVTGVKYWPHKCNNGVWVVAGPSVFLRRKRRVK